MKKIILSSLVAVFISISSIAYAGPFDFLDNNSSTEVTALSQKSDYINTKVGKASISFSKSVQDMLIALNRKEQAEKMKALTEEVSKKKNDTELQKKLIQATNNALEELNTIDLQGKLDSEESQNKLYNSILNMGAGIEMDAKAIQDSQDLGDASERTMNLVKSDPIRYGLSSISTVQSVLSTTKFVAENIPTQMNNVQKFSLKLADYAKTNKLKIPTADDIQKKAASMEKQ